MTDQLDDATAREAEDAALDDELEDEIEDEIEDDDDDDEAGTGWAATRAITRRHAAEVAGVRSRVLHAYRSTGSTPAEAARSTAEVIYTVAALHGPVPANREGERVIGVDVMVSRTVTADLAATPAPDARPAAFAAAAVNASRSAAYRSGGRGEWEADTPMVIAVDQYRDDPYAPELAGVRDPLAQTMMAIVTETSRRCADRALTEVMGRGLHPYVLHDTWNKEVAESLTAAARSLDAEAIVADRGERTDVARVQWREVATVRTAVLVDEETDVGTREGRLAVRAALLEQGRASLDSALVTQIHGVHVTAIDDERVDERLVLDEHGVAADDGRDEVAADVGVPTVTVYGRTTCIPTAATRRDLDRGGVPYTLVDIDQGKADVDALGYDTASTRTPVVVTASQHWSGHDVAHLRATIAAHGTTSARTSFSPASTAPASPSAHRDHDVVAERTEGCER